MAVELRLMPRIKIQIQRQRIVTQRYLRGEISYPFSLAGLDLAPEQLRDRREPHPSTAKLACEQCERPTAEWMLLRQPAYSGAGTGRRLCGACWEAWLKECTGEPLPSDRRRALDADRNRKRRTSAARSMKTTPLIPSNAKLTGERG